MKKTVLGLALALVCSASSASFESGEGLYSQCTSDRAAQQLACVAYIQGALDMGNNVHFCTPAMTGKQVMDITTEFLQRHPSVRHHGADLIIIKAFSNLYPCKEKKPTRSVRPV